MLDQLTIYHRNKGADPNSAVPDGFLHFATCMRSILIDNGAHDPFFAQHKNAQQGSVISDFERYKRAVKQSQSNADYQCYNAEHAYQFLLEVICGLHSKLVGETEVFGQFKAFINTHKDVFSGELNDVFESLIRDAKNIRNRHLQNFGAQSYGSLLRKKVSIDTQRVAFVGAGLLVRDMLPWISKTQLAIDIYTRNPQNHQDLNNQVNQVCVHDVNELQGSTDQTVLVVAAPISADHLRCNIKLNDFAEIYDLRANSDVDLLHLNNAISLKEFIGDLEKNQQEANRLKQLALKSVAEKARQKSLEEKQRPFDWEELWSYA